MFIRRSMLAFLAIACSLAVAGPAAGDGKVVVYSANDANLNRFVFDAFAHETGISVEQVEGGSGVVFRRIASERERSPCWSIRGAREMAGGQRSSG